MVDAVVDIMAVTIDNARRAQIVKQRIEARKVHSQVRRAHRLLTHRRGQRTQVFQEPIIVEVDEVDIAVVDFTLMQGSELILSWDTG